MSAKRVLVVDDEPTNRRYLEAALGALGYEVETREDAENTLASLAELAPDLVLLDWRMPGLSGAEAVRAFKAATSAKVVVCSAFADSSNKERIRESGCDGLLTKPVGVDELDEALERWLGADADSQPE